MKRVVAGCVAIVEALFAGPVYGQESQLAAKLVISEVVSSNATGFRDPFREPDDWIELHNRGTEAVQFEGLFITDSPNQPTQESIRLKPLEAGQFVLLWCDEGTRKADFGHCNIKLSAKGGWLGIYDRDSVLVDSLRYPPLRVNKSFGRLPEQGTGVWFERPSPLLENVGKSTSSARYCPDLVLSPPSGHHTERPTLVEVTAPNNTFNIVHTTNGSDPSGAGGKPVEEPIRVGSQKLIRAVAQSEECLTNWPSTGTYFVHSRHDLPIISLAVDNWRAFYNESNRDLTSREIPGHIEYYDEHQKLRFSEDVAVKLAGGASRLLPQKSISIKCRPHFGSDSIVCDSLYLNKAIGKHFDFTLRNSGNGQPRVFFKDAMLQGLLGGNPNIDFVGYRPAVAYINGRYAGIYNIRERKSKSFVQANHNISADSVQMIEVVGSAATGPNSAVADYKQLLQVLRDSSIEDSATYAWVCSQIDIDNFIDYNVAQLFYGNIDWPLANIKMWRKKKYGKWRWILFDLDQTCTSGMIDFRSFDYLMGENPLILAEDQPQHESVTRPFRILMQHPDFRARFFNRFADHLNYEFKAERMLAAIDRHKAMIESEVPRHLRRWGPKENSERPQIPLTMEQWEYNVSDLQRFARNRQRYIGRQLDSLAGQTRSASLSINIEEAEQGSVAVNGRKLEEASWRGTYYPNASVVLQAIPAEGYRFVKWKETGDQLPLISVPLAADKAVSLTPVFKKER